MEKTDRVADRNFYEETLASGIPLRATHVYHLEEPFTGLPEWAVNTVVCEAKSKTLKYKEAPINEPV